MDDDESSNSSQPSMSGMSNPQPQMQAPMVQRVAMVTTPSTTPTPTTLMLVTSNSANTAGSLVQQPKNDNHIRFPAAAGQTGTPTAITVRPAANGVNAGGLVVLSGTSVAGATPAQSATTPAQGGLPTTLAVRTATTANPNASKTHTILVMPVSSTGGSGDMSAAKRIKTE